MKRILNVSCSVFKFAYLVLCYCYNMHSESHFYNRSAQTIIKIIIFPMSVIGLNPLEESDFWQNTIRVYVCELILGYGMYSTLLFSYYSVGDFYSFVVPVAYFVCLLLVFINVWWLHSHRAEIRDLLMQIKRNIFEYPDESYFYNIYSGWLSEKSYRKLRNLILLLEIFGFIFAGSSPLIGYFFVGQMRTFIYPGWISWTVDTPLKYIGTYCLQATVASTVFWVYYMTQIYISFILVEFLRQFKKLDLALISLHERTVESVRMHFASLSDDLESNNVTDIAPHVKSSAMYKDMYDCTFRINLITCIKHHQHLLRYEFFRIKFQ